MRNLADKLLSLNVRTIFVLVMVFYVFLRYLIVFLGAMFPETFRKSGISKLKRKERNRIFELITGSQGESSETDYLYLIVLGVFFLMAFLKFRRIRNRRLRKENNEEEMEKDKWLTHLIKFNFLFIQYFLLSINLVLLDYINIYFCCFVDLGRGIGILKQFYSSLNAKKI